MHPSIPLYLLCALSLAWTGLVHSQGIYKSVDAQGNVTYSSRPPPAAAGVEPVSVQGDADQEATLKAERIRQETARRAAASEKQRAAEKAQKDTAIAEAKRRLEAAQDKLEAAKRRGDDDWQTIARGGRVESDAYRERVKQAEREARDADRAFKDAKAGKLPPEAKAKAESPGGDPKGKAAPAAAQSKDKGKAEVPTTAQPKAKTKTQAKASAVEPKAPPEAATSSTSRH